MTPETLIPAHRWPEFIEWARDCGYDESYHNRWDSKSHEIQRLFLAETAEEEA